jgi:hypothetical protein
METIRLGDLFKVTYGSNLALNALKKEEGGINFVSRTSKNNGVSATVSAIEGFPAISPTGNGFISVACGGSVLSSFLQTEPFYSGRDLVYLTPKKKLSRNILIFYCVAIKQNAFKYGYGRQANATLSDIQIPSLSSIPSWVLEPNENIPETLHGKCSEGKIELPNVSDWSAFELSDYFDMFSGKYTPKGGYGHGSVPLISASNLNNGVKGWTNLHPKFDSGCLTIGKVEASTFYQPLPFCSTGDVCTLKPKFNMSKFTALFVKTVISLESKKWSYGRQIRLNNCKNLKINLPSCINGEPDWGLMDEYMRSLPYSSSV